MSKKSLTASAGLLVTRDAIDVQHVRLDPGVPARVRRFARFIKEVLHADSAVPGLFAARLVALDGIRPGALERVQTGLPQLYIWREMTLVEWREDAPPHLERRAISPRTLAAMNSQPVPGATDLNLAAGLSLYLAQAPAYAGIRQKDQVHECERDALCWWYQCLPMPLFFHVSGLQPLSAVSRLCLAREQTRQVPTVSTLTHLDDPMAETESCSELLDAAAMSEGSDERPTVLRQALDRLESAAAEPDAAARRRWVIELLKLRFVALAAGPITSLLIAWLVDLCESGTVQSENPSKETPRDYFRRAAEPLLVKLRTFPSAISQWTLTLLDETYRDLISAELKANPGGASARKLASALSNFHAFLVEWFEMEPLRSRLHDAVPLVEVRANVIWTHVVDLAYGWIDEITDDRRLQTALRIVMSIAKEAPARSTELLFLRIQNVSQHDGFVEVEVAPSLRYGRLKTRAAQRRLRINDPVTITLLMSWVRERKAGGAGDGALLFADPVDGDSVYRRHTLSTFITVLLRSASGDPKSVGHDLRHTAVSDLNAPVLESSNITDINRLATNATTAGHVTSMTSLIHYTHLYEAALRHRLDAAIATLIMMTSKDAAGLVGISALNLRQRASRNGSDSDAYAWMLVFNSKGGSPAPEASAAWTWTTPVPPPTRRAGAFEPTVSISRLVLASLVARHGATEVGSHFMLPAIEIEALRDAALVATHETIRYTWPSKYGIRAKLPLGLAEALSIADVDLGEATAEKFEKLYQWLTAKQDSTLLECAYVSWRDCRVGNYLTLDVPTQAHGLLFLLSKAGVDPRALRVCYRTTEGNAPTDPQALMVAERDFAVVFGMKPRIWAAADRNWTSSTYLQWDSSDCIDKPHAASGSVRGLDAWMLTVGAHTKHLNQKGGTQHAQSL